MSDGIGISYAKMMARHVHVVLLFVLEQYINRGTPCAVKPTYDEMDQLMTYGELPVAIAFGRVVDASPPSDLVIDCPPLNTDGSMTLSWRLRSGQVGDIILPPQSKDIARVMSEIKEHVTQLATTAMTL